MNIFHLFIKKIIFPLLFQILSDPEQRTEYDYMLDNPDQMYYHYYRYYRRRVSTKVDVRLVIISILLIISSIQVSFIITVVLEMCLRCDYYNYL